MPNDIVIELWHHGGQWSLKKSGEQYWYKGKKDTEWKSGLPRGMKAQDAGTGLPVKLRESFPSEFSPTLRFIAR